MVNTHIYKFITRVKLDILTKYLLRKKLKIIMYHGIIDDDVDMDCWWLIKKSKFLEQINYLNKNFNFISIDHALESDTIFQNTCVLTFDDGYKSVLTHAYPILVEKNIPFTVYITTGPVEKGTFLWPDIVFAYLYKKKIEEKDQLKIRLDRYPKHYKIDKKNYIEAALSVLKRMDYRKRNAIIEELVNEDIFFIKTLKANGSPFEILSVSDVKKLAADSLVTIGAHSVNHEVLTIMPLDEAEREIRDSRAILRDWTKRKICHFSYPDGKFNKQLTNKVEQLGFKSASRIGLCVNWDIKRFELCRVGTGSWDDDYEFRSMINGIIPLKIGAKMFLRRLVKAYI